MFLTEDKLRNRISELSSYRYRDARLIPQWRFSIDEEGAIGTRPNPLLTEQTITIGETWKGRDVYAWLSCDVEIPIEWGNRRIVGRFNFGRTGAGNNSGFESLLYLNGEPFQGVDSNHQEVFLPAETVGQTVRLDLRLWSGLEGGGRPREQEYKLATAELAWLDEDVDDLYYTALAMRQTIAVLDEQSLDRIELLSVLDDAFRLLDWSVHGSASFYESAKAARKHLQTFLDSVEKRTGITATCIGHTHIDVAWLWRLTHTREKSARSFSTVLRLMEQFPEYMFLQTQPQLYDYIKTDYPDIYAAIRTRIAEGRWEAGGAMWLEADCNLISGESLVRQILYGTRFFEQEFGTPCTYLWLPDVFGYSWALPQVMKLSGLDTFMTTKISWNKYNRMPHDTFTWRGIDGSEVLAHFITTPEPDAHGWFYTYNGQLLASTVAGAWKGYQDKRLNRELLISYGYGDGGGGVNREMLEMRRRLDQMPGLPRVVTGRADEYFSRLKENVQQSTEYVHTWDGELYLEYHRGTYTSQSYNKRMNRKLELAYRETEWLGVWASATLMGNENLQPWREQLSDGWKIILRNQFHDIIPGSSIREVYEDCRVEYAEASAIVESVWGDAASHLVKTEIDALVVFNSAAWNRAGIVRLRSVSDSHGMFETGTGETLVETSSARIGNYTDSTGCALPAQRVGGETWVQVANVPSLGMDTITVHGTANLALADSPFAVADGKLSTPFYELEWNSQGQLTRIFDVHARREVLTAGARGNVLQVFEDKPLGNDAWDIDLFYQEKMREITELASVETISVGPIAAIVRFSWTFVESKIEQDLIVYTASQRIDFVTRMDWQERQQLLKVAFPIDVRATEATFDIQFGNVKRPTHWNTSWDQARFETVGHQWADLSESDYGVALANDCKYGYDVKDNVLRLSLLKSAVYPDPEADRGQHEFTYALIPHSGGWSEGGIVQEAWDLNSPLRAEVGQYVGRQGSLFTLSSSRVMVDAVKPAEDDNRILLRLHEFAGGREVIEAISDLGILSWQPCDLLERALGEEQFGLMRFDIKPFEIKSFLIRLGNGESSVGTG